MSAASRHSRSAAMSSRLPNSSGETLAAGWQGTETCFGATQGILMTISGSQTPISARSTDKRASQGFLLERYSMANPRRRLTGGADLIRRLVQQARQAHRATR